MAGNRGRVTPLPAPPVAAPGTLDNAVRIADYHIAVTLVPASKRLNGHEHITYRNTTPDPIPNLVFHLYLNAFRDLDSVYMQESATMHPCSVWTGTPSKPAGSG